MSDMANTAPDRSALVVLVPEAVGLEPFRDKHDPSAAAGVSAHVLSPFMTPSAVGPTLIDELGRHFASVSRFHFALKTVKRFVAPIQVLYLEPEPSEPFRQLTLGIWKRHPDWPPYEGRHSDIVPHMCLAQPSSIAELDEVAGKFAQECEAALPIYSTAAGVALMDRVAGRWSVRTRFALA
jgi:hypothetical protein